MSLATADRALAQVVDQATALARRMEAVDPLMRAGSTAALFRLLSDERDRLNRMIRTVRRRGL